MKGSVSCLPLSFPAPQGSQGALLSLALCPPLLQPHSYCLHPSSDLFRGDPDITPPLRHPSHKSLVSPSSLSLTGTQSHLPPICSQLSHSSPAPPGPNPTPESAHPNPA